MNGIVVSDEVESFESHRQSESSPQSPSHPPGFPLSHSHDGGDSSLSGDSAMQENQLGSQENVV